MELERTDTRHWHVAIGPVEKWVVSTLAIAIVSVAYWFVSSVLGRLDKQGEAMNDLSRQQAVTNSQLITLNLQLANVPALSERVSRTEVKIQALEEGQKELRQVRGLK